MHVRIPVMVWVCVSCYIHVLMGPGVSRRRCDMLCVRAFQDDSSVEGDCQGRPGVHETSNTAHGIVAASPNGCLEHNSVEPALHCWLCCAPGGTWGHAMAAVLPCSGTPVRTRTLMDTSPGMASSSSSSFSKGSSFPGQSSPGLPFIKLRPEAKESTCAPMEGEAPSFIEEAVYFEEEFKEMSSWGELLFENHAKRRRITGKQPAPGARTPAVASPGGDDKALEEDHVLPNWKVNKNARVLYAVSAAKGRKMEESYKDRYEKAYLQWRDLTGKQRQQWIDKGSGTTRTTGPNGPIVAVVSSEMPEDACTRSWCYSPGMLFTFNGSWLLDDEAYLKVVKEWQTLPHILERCVKDVPAVQSLFKEFSELVQKVSQVYKCRKWTACVELSLKAEDLGRLHLHCFLERNCKEDKAWAKWGRIAERMIIRGMGVSHSAACAVRSRGRNRDRALTEGHYYCQAPKIGHVLHDSNCKKFEAIFPDSKMVVSLWRTRKMSTEAAKVEVLMTRDRVPSVLTMLETTMSLEYAQRVEVEAKAAESDWQRKPFKTPSLGELEWVRQFAVTALEPHMMVSRSAEYCRTEDLVSAAALRRSKFLVYDGPSRMGKTELASSWFTAEYTLVVNAQECATPNLRPLLKGRHRAILFDEGGWELCWKNKAMMQGSPRTVTMAQSQCNDRCYDVLLFRVPMIVCSNTFWEGCNDPEARDWIEKNSIFVEVKEKVFEETDAQ